MKKRDMAPLNRIEPVEVSLMEMDACQRKVNVPTIG